MSTGNWLNNDNLYLEFGTTKAVVEPAGEFKQYGDNRVVEVLIDLTTLTSTAAIQSNTLFFPSGTSNIFIEKVQMVTEVAAASGTSFSVGLIQDDRSTIPTNYSTAFINAEVLLRLLQVLDTTSLLFLRVRLPLVKSVFVSSTMVLERSHSK